MPAAPLLVIAAVETGAAAAIGTAVVGAVTTATVSTAVATAVGAGVISGGIAAAQGADAGDVLKAAVIGGGAGYVGGVAGEAARGALPGSTSAAVANTVSAAAASGTSSAVASLAQTGDVGKALEAGAKGAAMGGLVQAGVEGVKGVTAQGPQQAGEARLKVPQQGQYELGKPIAEVPSQVGITERVPTGGGTGLVADPSLLYSSKFAPSQPMRATEDGGVQPAYQTAQSLITPESLSAYSQPYRETKAFTPPPLTRSEESVLREALQLGISDVFTRQPTQMAAQPAGGGTRQVGPVDTTATPGSQALAQALRVGDLGAPIFGRDEGEGRRGGWNVASLRYMGNSEA